MNNHPRHAVHRERDQVSRLLRHHRCNCEECEEVWEELQQIRSELEEILDRIPEPDTTPASIQLHSH